MSPRLALADEDLLAELQAGNELAEQAFVQRYRPRLEGLARLRGFSPEDAEEIAQDTMLAALEHLRSGRFEGRSQLASWVRAIFDRRAADHYRRHGRRGARTISLDQMPSADIASAGGLVSSADAPTTLLVRAVLASLSPKHRLILVLNVHRGLPAREIATILRLGVKSTEAILTAAKKQFRREVAEQSEGSRRKALRACD